MRRLVIVGAALCLTASSPVSAQQFDYSQNIADSTARSISLAMLAQEVIAVYKNSSRERFLDNRFRLEIVAERYDDALNTIEQLRDVLRTSQLPRGAWVNAQYAI